MPNKTIKKRCSKHGEVEHFVRKEGGYRCRKCSVISTVERRRKIKRDLVEIFGGKCVKCGYNKCIASLEFHHLDRKTKKFSIGGYGVCYSFEKMLAEAKKCILVCRNCHGEIENGVIV